MASNNAVQNRNASIRTRMTRNGKLRTETYRRDENTFAVAVNTLPDDNSTLLSINSPDGSIYRFDGRTARTIYRTLQKHYQVQDKTW